MTALIIETAEHISTTNFDCDYCEAPADISADDNAWESSQACEQCHEALSWKHEHQPSECEDGPPIEDDHFACDRDHDNEIHESMIEAQIEILRDLEA